MADQIQQQLIALAQGFTVISFPGANIFETKVQLKAPVGELGGLKISLLQTVTEIVQSPVDLGWIIKNDRFITKEIANNDPVGGLPITDLLQLNIGTVTNGATNPPGVPGLLGAITGKVPIPVQTAKLIDFAVSVAIRWRILDENGNVVSDLSWSIGAGMQQQQGTIGDIFPQPGNELDVLDVVFPLLFTELVFPPPVAQKRTIMASIRLDGAGSSSGWIDLPPVTVLLPVIPVPTIVLQFENTSFKGKLLAIVPANSPLDASTIGPVVDTLKNTVTPLQNTFAFLSLFIGVAGDIATALNGASITFVKADEIKNYDDIVWQEHWYNDEEPEDEISSMIFVGPPSRQVQCFNARNLSDGEGEMIGTIGQELCMRFENLHSDAPVSQSPPPALQNLGTVFVPKKPTGYRWLIARSIESFGDEFSSMRFSWSV